MSSTHHHLAPAKVFAGLLLVISFALTACGSTPAPASGTPSSQNLPTRTATEIPTVASTTTPTLQPTRIDAQASSTPHFTATVLATPPTTHTIAAETTPSPTVTQSLPTATIPRNTATPNLPTVTATAGTAALVFPSEFSRNKTRGAALFQTMQCTGCHIMPTAGRRVAPDLSHIATDALEIIHRPDYHGQATSAPQYIFESIMRPNAYVLPPFNTLTIDGTSIMPKDFEQRMTPEQIQDVIAYLMTMK